MKRIICMLLAALMLFSLAACKKNDGSLEDYLQNNGGASGDVDYPVDQPVIDPAAPVDPQPGDVENGSTAGEEEGDISSYIPEGGDAIPSAMIGGWSYVEIYQWAQASDITVDEAINREKDSGVYFGYTAFSRYNEAVSSPLYKTNENATFDDMAAFGIDPTGLTDLFGESPRITSVAVNTEDGITCTTVFLIEDNTLIAFGEGMNVFMYERMESVG